MKSKTSGENLTWWKIAVEEKTAVLHSMKQKFNVQVDSASNFDDDKRLLDRRLAKVVADSIALACVYSLSPCSSALGTFRGRDNVFFPAKRP